MSWALCASMMQGHALQLKRQHSATLTNEDENKENSTPVQLVKQSWTSSHQPMHVDMMVGLMECPKEVQEWLLEEHIHMSENNHLAREWHEHTMSALLAVIHEGLLTSIKFGSMNFTGNIYIHVGSHKHSAARHGCWRCFQ